MLLSQKLYELRKERNLSLQSLHLKTGIALASLSAYERGKYTPSLENLCKLSIFYDVSLDDLLGRDAQLKLPRGNVHHWNPDTNSDTSSKNSENESL